MQASLSAPWTATHKEDWQKPEPNVDLVSEERYYLAHSEDEPGKSDYCGSVLSSRASGGTQDQSSEGQKKTQAAGFYQVC